MKLNFILLAIVIAFIICYCFSKKRIQEGQISAAPQTSGGLLNGYEDILIGVNKDYKLFRFNNPKKEWHQLRGKSCCVTDLAYWNDTLLGIGRYDHRLYAWDKMGVRGGLWKLATNLPMEWMQSIGVWKNKLFSANQQSLFRWTGKADGKSVDPFKRGKGNKPAWVWCGAKPNVKSIKEYRNQLYVVDKQGRIEMFVDGKLDQNGKLKGSWKRIGQPTEGLRSICEWNDKLMGIGTDNHLYEWSDERQNWFSKTTKFKLLSIMSLSYDQYQSQFNKPKIPFSCADGFKLETQDGKRCYRAEGEELDWWSAYNKCKDADPGRKTTLAVISSKNEDDFVKDLMQHPKWIGCSDKDKEGEWKWPDGETLQKKGYSNWNQKEPNNAGGDEHYCEQYESGVWNDMPANVKKPYVCSHTTSLRREAGGKGGGRKCTEHKDKKKNYLYWNSNKWPVTAKDKEDCKNLCQNDTKCPQADYYETGKRCYLYADNGSAGARRPKMTGSTPGETYFKCNTEAFTGSMKEGFREGQYSKAARGRTCAGEGKRQITSAADCKKAHQTLFKKSLNVNQNNWGANGNIPPGCFSYPEQGGNQAYFNIGAGSQDGRAHRVHPNICGGGTTNTTGYSIAASRRTCQGDGKTQITNAADCWKALQELKNQGVLKGNLSTKYNQSWGGNRNLAKGCFTYNAQAHGRHYQYFNTSNIQSAGQDGQIAAAHPAVCGGGTAAKTTTTGKVRLAGRRQSCSNSELIKTAAECGRAALKLRDEQNYFKSGNGLMSSNSAGARNFQNYDRRAGYKGTTAHPYQSSWHHLPQGCSVHTGNTNNHVYFNTRRPSYVHQNYQAVCGNAGETKTTSSGNKPFRVLTGKGQCPPDERIPDRNTCRKAYDALRASGDLPRADPRQNAPTHSRHGTNYPNGCFTYKYGSQPNYIYWNTAGNYNNPNTAYPQHPAVCGNSGTKKSTTSSGSKPPPKGTIGIHYKSVKWSSQAGRPAATTAFKRFMAAQTSGTGYCTKNLDTLWGFKNQTTCPGGKRDNIAWEITVNFKEPIGAIWYIEPGVDFGLGGFLEIDGKAVASHNSDQWGGGRPESSNLKYQGRIAAGDHVMKLYGAENCCDGQSHIRFKRDNGKWRHMTKAELEAVGKIKGGTLSGKSRGSVPKISELAGDYDVYYKGRKRINNEGGARGLQITCDGKATQPGVFTDKVHIGSTHTTKCKNDASTFMFEKTHGANKHECLRKAGDKIEGDHYINNGQYWGSVEYRKKANQDGKYTCYGDYKASAPSVGVGDGKTLVFDNVTIGSAKERSAVFTIKKTAFITKIEFEHKAGRVGCAGGSSGSNFGCGGSRNYIALLITDSNKREILPNINVKGYKKTGHNSKTQAHWYTMDGVGQDTKKMVWDLKTPQTFMPGDYRLWYGEDLTNWTEQDNIGWATYKITMTDEAGNTTKFKDQMLKDLHSGLCLGVEQKGDAAQPGDGGRVVLSWCQRSDDKMWSYDPDSMQLTNRIPGVCAVVQGASKAGNAQIIMGKCSQGNGVRHFYNKTNGSFYTESSQCFENHSASKQVPKKNLLPGSIVQNPCTGGKNQRFSVVAPPPAPPAFKSSSERNSVMLVGETPLTIKKNNLLRMINAERDYRLEFTITPTAKIPGWSEIFHVTISDRDCCGIGDRMPGMWFYSNTTRLHIRSGGADGGNLGIDPPMELPLNKETTVVIELLGKFMTVKYSGGVTFQSTIARSDDRPYGKAKFYACSNWYNAAKASVKNVKWTNKTTPPLGKNAVMCSFNVGGTVNSIKYKNKDLKVYGDKADWKAIKTVNFDSGGEDPGKIIVDAQNSQDGDGCKTSGFIMSCQADPSNPWNDFTSNKTHWSAVGTAGQSFRDKSGFPCETTASNLSLSPKEGFRGFREGLAPGKKIWASTGQKTVKIEGGPRLSPEVSCPTDFHGMPLKITAWGASHDNGTGTVQTEGGAFNIFNKDTGRLRGSDKIRLRPKQPKNGKWFADPIKERKTDSQGTLYLKTHMNPQWVRIPNDYRECFKDATELFVTSGDLGGGNSGEQCSGGLQYILHPKGSLCPEKTQIKTRKECENAIVSLGIGKGEKDNYPWDKVLESKSPAGCSWTDRVGGDGPATARWNAWPNSAGDPLETYHPVCYSKPPSQAAIELIKTEGCHKCPQGTYSKEGSNECVVCTKNSTNKECREGGKDQTSGLVCPAGTSSTGAVVTAEGKPMNLGEEQSSGNNSSESLKDQCKAFNSGAICDPACNNTHGRCVGGMCMCGGGYRGPTCDEAPKARIPTIEEWNAAFEANKDTKQAQEEANKPETISYGYHEHTNMNKPFTDSLRELNKDVQELLVEARKQKEKKKKQRSFLPSEFLGWSNAIPGLLGKQYKGGAQPKPIDVGIAIDDRRKIHFRQQAKGKDTKLASVKSSPQVISSDAGKITSGSAQDDLKGANSFKDPKKAPYRGFNDDSYLKGPNKPIQRA